ncbi:MAG: hypothetical protein ACYC0I_03300 [Acidimicrobiales bacterium]
MSARHHMTRLLVAVLAATTTLVIPPGSSGASGVTHATHLRPLMLVKVPLSDTIYVVGNLGCDSSRCLHLVRTNDALSSYTTVQLPPVTPVRGVASGSLGQVDFATSRDGYALDEVKGVTTLFVTRDGARSWHRQVVSKGLVIAQLAASAGTVDVVAMRCAKQNDGNTGCTHYELFRSDLAAKRWTATPIPNGNVTPWGFLGKPAVLGNRVWLSEQLRKSLLISSLDGGASFKSRVVSKLGSVAGCNLTASSTTSLWAECPTGMMVSFFFSGDAGRSWTSLRGPDLPQFAGTGGGAFDPVSPRLAYIDFGQFPRTNNVYRVSNRGRAVTAVGTLTCPEVLSMMFTSQSQGVAICSDFQHTHFERSTDGGVHWRRFELR